MQIRLNGQQREIADNATLATLVGLLELAERRIAVEVNAELVPRTLHEQHVLQPGDNVEIVHAIGGG